jgi:putative ABC transport system permease protein
MKTTTLKLAARNTLRRKSRTALTVGMVVFGVALLLLSVTWVHGAMGNALATATAVGGHVRLVQPEFAAREELSPLEAHVSPVGPLVETLRQQPGVVAVFPRIATGVTVTVGEEIGEVFAQVIGAEEAYFREQLGAKARLASGSWFSGAPDEMIVGAKVAEQAGAKLGDELLLLGMTQDGSLSPVTGKVIGIVRGAGAGLDQQVLVPLEKLQWLTDLPEGATELLVYAQSYEQAPQLASQLRTLPELRELQVQAWSEREPWRSMAASVKGTQSVIILVLVFLASLGIWNTMMMSVLERTHEVGVLRAMGLSRLGAVGLFVGEALAIGVIGGAVGVALGAWPSWLLEKHGVAVGEQTASNMAGAFAERMHGDLSLEGVLLSFGLGLLMAVLGSVLPALRAASIQPVSAMRSGR